MHELSQAFATLGAVEHRDAALMARLRKVVRPKLHLMKPQQLTASLLGLARLQYRDGLLLDEFAG